jgi:hypothetical protein
MSIPARLTRALEAEVLRLKAVMTEAGGYPLTVGIDGFPGRWGVTPDR